VVEDGEKDLEEKDDDDEADDDADEEAAAEEDAAAVETAAATDVPLVVCAVMVPAGARWSCTVITADDGGDGVGEGDENKDVGCVDDDADDGCDVSLPEACFVSVLVLLLVVFVSTVEPESLVAESLRRSFAAKEPNSTGTERVAPLLAAVVVPPLLLVSAVVPRGLLLLIRGAAILPYVAESCRWWAMAVNTAQPSQAPPKPRAGERARGRGAACQQQRRGRLAPCLGKTNSGWNTCVFGSSRQAGVPL
jgi:hypothetical protein